MSEQSVAVLKLSPSRLTNEKRLETSREHYSKMFCGCDVKSDSVGRTNSQKG